MHVSLSLSVYTYVHIYIYIYTLWISCICSAIWVYYMASAAPASSEARCETPTLPRSAGKGSEASRGTLEAQCPKVEAQCPKATLTTVDSKMLELACRMLYTGFLWFWVWRRSRSNFGASNCALNKSVLFSFVCPTKDLAQTLGSHLTPLDISRVTSRATTIRVIVTCALPGLVGFVMGFLWGLREDTDWT